MCLNLDGNEPLVAHWQGLRPDALPIVIILATVYFLPLIPNRTHATLMLAFSALLRQREALTERSNFANHP